MEYKKGMKVKVVRDTNSHGKIGSEYTDDKMFNIDEDGFFTSSEYVDFVWFRDCEEVKETKDKKPTIEDVKKHFRYVSKIKPVGSEKVYDIDIYRFGVINDHGWFRQGRNKEGLHILLKDGENYSEIVETKTLAPDLKRDQELEDMVEWFKLNTSLGEKGSLTKSDCEKIYKDALDSIESCAKDDYNAFKGHVIQVPEGMIFDEENSNIVFKKIEPKLAETWDEYCDGKGFEFIHKFNELWFNVPNHYNALRKLEFLRNHYNGDWVADFSDGECKFKIKFSEGNLGVGQTSRIQSLLVFKTEEIANKFLANFRDLIETAKPLL